MKAILTRENTKFVKVTLDLADNVLACCAYGTRKEAKANCQAEEYCMADTICYDTVVPATNFVEDHGDFQIADGVMVWPIPVALSEDLKGKAAKWGAFMGRDMANRTVGLRYFQGGFENWFDDDNLRYNARHSSCGQANEYSIPRGSYPEWEALFVAAYEAAYRQYKADWESSKAAVK